MSRSGKSLWLAGALGVAAQTSALACATCYGASDSPLAQGMNWGIATLLGVIGVVLAGVVAFFVHVGLRSAKVNAPRSQTGADNRAGTQPNVVSTLPTTKSS